MKRQPKIKKLFLDFCNKNCLRLEEDKKKKDLENDFQGI